ncbi:MAG: radical SAM protein [Acidobacteriota bacterium]|nr:radical SAM protein [Acidobacteriota bacterium]
MFTRSDDFDNLWVWNDPQIRHRTAWYREVAANRMPARYLIASRVAVDVDPASEETELWSAFDRATQTFLALQERIKSGQVRLADLPRLQPNLRGLAVELGRRMLTHCNFCRWNCRVDRSTKGKRGTCGLGAASRVGSYFQHRGEELIFRGTHGSGTIFFTSCNMRCAFCQNGDISTDKHNGMKVTPAKLASIARELRLGGCHNINWVGGDPTIHLHTILAAIDLLDDETAGTDPSRIRRVEHGFGLFDDSKAAAYHQGEFNVPLLWNSNMFTTLETMKLLRVLIDVWLPDFKFGPGKCAVAAARTPWYWETVTGNLALLRDWGEDAGIRHLIMPNHVDCCTEPVLDWLAENWPDVPINIMDQYRPDTHTHPSSPTYQPRYAPLSRRPRADEIQQAYSLARERGLPFETITFERPSEMKHPF